MSVTVRNVGARAVAATTLRFYRSGVPTITPADTEVGSHTIVALSSSGSISGSLAVIAPDTPGTYYYGACVDAVPDETDTTNNCSAAVRITVQDTAAALRGHPDLTVAAPTVSNGGPAVGAQFVLSVTVRNDGSGAAGPTTLHYYRSPHEAIATSDADVGRDAVARLAGSGSGSQSVDLTAPATPGVYYYGACVAPVTDESDTTNNCSASVQVTVRHTVTESQGSPDLTVASATVSDSSPAAGMQFSLSATVGNGGDGGAQATTLRYYRSADATITPADTEVETAAIVGLAASGSAGGSVDLTAPSTPGIYYYGACVDPVAGESDTTNNCSGSVRVTTLQPDLVVGPPSVSDSGPAAGTRFTLSVTVQNDGEGQSEATTLRYFHSTDTAITTSDTQVDTDAVAGLTVSGSGSESVVLTAPSTPGTYYYGACVDAVADESDTTNNCSAPVQVTVPQPTPDLVVGRSSVDDSGPDAGAPFTLSATVENEGQWPAAATTLRYYRSDDATIATTDTEVGTDTIAGLAASGSSSQSVQLTAPETAGMYYYGACVDAVADESDTTNNCSAPASVQVTVPEAEQAGPSVEVSAADDKEWAPVGDTVDLSARVLDDAGEEVSTATVSWSSSNTAVATVDSTGMMTAVGAGTVTLTATATVSGTSTQTAMARRSGADGPRGSDRTVMNSEKTITASIKMVVVMRAARIELSPESLSFDSVGALGTITATVYDEDDNVMQPTYWGWSSANNEVATASGTFPGSGVMVYVKAIGEGTTTVTLRVNGSAMGTASVTVTLPTARVSLSPASLTFEALGGTETVMVTVLDENGDEVEDASFSYFSAFSACCGIEFGTIPDGIAITIVDGGLEITAAGTGSGQISVTSPGVESALLLVKVYQKPASVTVSPDSVNLEADQTATLAAVVLDANGHSIPLADSERGGLVVYWATSDAEVATIAGADSTLLNISSDETGATATATAVAAGSATITARWGSSISGTATITVTDSS